MFWAAVYFVIYFCFIRLASFGTEYYYFYINFGLLMINDNKKFGTDMILIRPMYS